MPDLETRIAILRKKAQLENLSVPSDVLHFIAETVVSNIRELEGALNRILAYSSLVNRPVNLDIATEALKDVWLSPGLLVLAGVSKAVENINKVIAPALVNKVGLFIV